MTFSRESALEGLTDPQQARVYALACAQAVLAEEMPGAELLIRLATYIDTGRLVPEPENPPVRFYNPVPPSGSLPAADVRFFANPDVLSRIS